MKETQYYENDQGGWSDLVFDESPQVQRPLPADHAHGPDSWGSLYCECGMKLSTEGRCPTCMEEHLGPETYCAACSSMRRARGQS